MPVRHSETRRQSVLDSVAEDARLQDEITQLLRTPSRHLRLSAQLDGLFRTYAWDNRSKTARFWMMTVTAVNLLVIPLDYFMQPSLLVPAILLRAMFIPLVFAITVQAWRRPHGARTEGMAVVLFTGSMMVLAGVLGALADPALAERYMFACLFVVSTSIVLISLNLWWSMINGAVICALYLFFQLLNPGISALIAVLMTIFFGMVIAALVQARRVANIAALRGALMRFRDAHQVRRLADANAQLHRLATTDSLTGLLNRRSINEALENAFDRLRSGQHMSLAILDIDHFKSLNDTLGHPEGDRCLKLVAAAMASAIRAKSDFLGRIGGEEFLLVMPDSGNGLAAPVCERLRTAVEALGIHNPGSPTSPRVTISIGVATTSFGAETSCDPETLLRMADEALYVAKRSGRNRVAQYEMEPAAAAERVQPGRVIAAGSTMRS